MRIAGVVHLPISACLKAVLVRDLAAQAGQQASTPIGLVSAGRTRLWLVLKDKDELKFI